MIHSAIIVTLLLSLQFFLSFNQSNTLLENDSTINYALNFSGIGSDPVNQCAYQNRQGRCLLCIDGYFLDVNGSCIKIQQKCKFFDFQRNLCLQCFQYFKLEYGSCLDLRCKNNGLFLCYQCLPGYKLALGGFCIDIKCKQYQNGDCKTCQQHYAVNKKSKMCQQIEPNVQTFISIGISPQTDLGCLIFNKRAQCIRCRQNYQLSNITCIKKEKKQLCSLYNPKTNQCLKCVSGYQARNGSCFVIKPLNCKVEDLNKCIECLQNYELRNGVCIKTSYKCINYNQSTNRCQECSQGYVPVQGQCKEKVSNSSLNSTRLEQQLSAQYCLKKDSKTKKCLECYQYFFLSEGFCKRVSQLCKSYNQQNGNCLQCFRGYILREGKCIPDQSRAISTNCEKLADNQTQCEKCKPRFFKSPNSLCLEALPSCREYNTNNGSCISCYKGFSLRRPYCQVIVTRIAVSFCIQYNPIDPRQCLRCAYGFYLHNNKCHNEDFVCQKTEPNKQNCIKCIEPFLSVNGKCIKEETVQIVSPNCEQHDITGLCVKCSQGYKSINYVCYPQEL